MPELYAWYVPLNAKWKWFTVAAECQSQHQPVSNARLSRSLCWFHMASILEQQPIAFLQKELCTWVDSLALPSVMKCLSRGPNSLSEGLVVSDERAPVSLCAWPEVPKGDEGSYQLPIIHASQLLPMCQDLAKESQWMPLTLHKLFHDGINAKTSESTWLAAWKVEMRVLDHEITLDGCMWIISEWKGPKRETEWGTNLWS